MNELAALVAFAFAGSVSPGPNNAVLWASGLAFGLRRTIPHILGTAIGITLLVVGVAAGIGVLLESAPLVEVGLKLAGSIYLLYVAVLVLRSGAVRRATVSRPFTLWQAAAFQCLNPKAWVFVVAAVGTFLPRESSGPIGVLVLTGVIVVVVTGSSAIWAAGGAALGRVVHDDRKRRVISIALAILLVASVALLWVEPKTPKNKERSQATLPVGIGPVAVPRLWGFPGTPQAQAVALPTHTPQVAPSRLTALTRFGSLLLDLFGRLGPSGTIDAALLLVNLA